MSSFDHRNMDVQQWTYVPPSSAPVWPGAQPAPAPATAAFADGRQPSQGRPPQGSSSSGGQRRPLPSARPRPPPEQQQRQPQKQPSRWAAYNARAAAARATARQLRNERRGAGLCTACGRLDAAPERVRCQPCGEQQQQQQPAGQPPSSSYGARAAAARKAARVAAKRAAARQLRDERRGAGLCTACGRLDAAPKRVRCQPCGELWRRARGRGVGGKGKEVEEVVVAGTCGGDDDAHDGSADAGVGVSASRDGEVETTGAVVVVEDGEDVPAAELQVQHSALWTLATLAVRELELMKAEGSTR
ncbi:hypothetical protein GGR56DRAFT_696429 [Xylariaceae sp. FL0804]|nr:hypothetical protein GGR56DRAFT_696429 [Xylariaceae sp. FL0804]